MLQRLSHSVARDRKVAGDLEGARNYGSTARLLNIVSTVLAAVTILIVIITVIVLSVEANRPETESWLETWRVPDNTAPLPATSTSCPPS
eukprot:superscaffoldBa00003512_g17100